MTITTNSQTYNLGKEFLTGFQLETFMEFYAYDKMQISPFETTIDSLVNHLTEFKKKLDNQGDFKRELINLKDKLIPMNTETISDLWDFCESEVDFEYHEEFRVFLDMELTMKFEEKIRNSDDSNEQLTLNLLTLVIQNKLVHVYTLDALGIIPFDSLVKQFKEGLLRLEKEVDGGLLTGDIAKTFEEEIINLKQMKQRANLPQTGDYIYAMAFERTSAFKDILEEILNVHYSNVIRVGLLKVNS